MKKSGGGRLEPFEDRRDPGNGVRHHSGLRCLEEGCAKPAGTAWSEHWCFEHNRDRMRRIAAVLNRRARS